MGEKMKNWAEIARKFGGVFVLDAPGFMRRDMGPKDTVFKFSCCKMAEKFVMAVDDTVGLAFGIGVYKFKDEFYAFVRE